MDIFLKAAGGVLIALILWITLSKQGKDMSLLLSIGVCAMVVLGAAAYFQPVVNFFRRLQSMGDLDGDLVAVVLKVVGIGMIGEICTLICKDAGNESMGKALQLMSSGVILWVSIPIFDKLLLLLERIMGTL